MIVVVIVLVNVFDPVIVAALLDGNDIVEVFDAVDADTPGERTRPTK